MFNLNNNYIERSSLAAEYQAGYFNTCVQHFVNPLIDKVVNMIKAPFESKKNSMPEIEGTKNSVKIVSVDKEPVQTEIAVHYLFRNENRDILPKILSNLNDMEYSKLREVSKAANEILSKNARGKTIKRHVARYEKIKTNASNIFEISSENLKIIPDLEKNKIKYFLPVGRITLDRPYIKHPVYEWTINNINPTIAYVDLEAFISPNGKKAKIKISFGGDSGVVDTSSTQREAVIISKVRKMLSQGVAELKE